MKFEVTEEIYEYFENKTVKISEIKKLIPNYMDYAESELKQVDQTYECDISDRLNKLLFNERIVINPIQLSDKIYDAFCNADKTVESQNFSILLDEYSGFTIYSVKETLITERDDKVLTRLRNEIADYKTKKAKQLKVSKELLSIAGNEELMQELLKLREQMKSESL